MKQSTEPSMFGQVLYVLAIFYAAGIAIYSIHYQAAYMFENGYGPFSIAISLIIGFIKGIFWPWFIFSS